MKMMSNRRDRARRETCLRWPARLSVPLFPVLLIAGCPPPAPFASIELIFNANETPTPVAAHDSAYFQTGLVFDAITGKVGHHAPTIAALPDGELLAAWYSYDGPGELDGAAIYTARWDPSSETWSQLALHIDRPEADGNPVLYAEGPEVWMFQAVVPGPGWSSAHIEWQKSNDGGRTWSTPRVIPGPLGANVRYPPVRLADDTLLLPAYDDLVPRSLFFTSTDGESWQLRSALATTPPHHGIQPSLAVLDGGRILAAMRNTGRGWLWVTASDDDGFTWSPPQDGGFPNPASPAALVRLAGGNLLLVYNDSATVRRPLSATISADAGRTWHRSRSIGGGDGELSYPAAVQAADGMIHIVYSHNRERIGHRIVNESWLAGNWW